MNLKPMPAERFFKLEIGDHVRIDWMKDDNPAYHRCKATDLRRIALVEDGVIWTMVEGMVSRTKLSGESWDKGEIIDPTSNELNTSRGIARLFYAGPKVPVGTVKKAMEIEGRGMHPLEGKENMEWLFSTHVTNLHIRRCNSATPVKEGIIIVPAHKDGTPPLNVISAIIVGNEDCPEQIWVSVKKQLPILMKDKFVLIAGTDTEDPTEAKS